MTNYEIKLNDLFSQLFEVFEEYLNTLYEICDKPIHFKEDINELNEKLQDLVLKSYDLIKEIEKTFNASKPLEAVHTLSEKIHSIVEDSAAIRYKLKGAKRTGKISQQEVRNYKNLLHNLECLDKFINKYNSNFEEKLITISQAGKLCEEAIDDFFESITGGWKGNL